MLYVVVFSNEAHITLPAISKADAIKKAYLALEQSAGLTPEEILPISHVVLCH